MINNEELLKRLVAVGLDRLPHALLLVGAEGAGKGAFAERLAHLLLCESPTAVSLGRACGECQACRWLAVESHPDFRMVEPEGLDDDEEGGAERGKKRASRMIKIDQIRDLEGFVFVGSHRAGRRAIVIRDAESMNGPAANSLLKILEEPPASVYFILTSSRQKFLLPTIRSRCRVLGCAVPSEGSGADLLKEFGLGKEAIRFLPLAGGATARVAKWNEDGILDALDAVSKSLMTASANPLELAARWDGLLRSEAKLTLDQLVEEIQRWVFDFTQEAGTGTVRYHSAWPRAKMPVGGYDMQALIAAWRELIQFRRSSRHPLNQLLFLESLANCVVRGLQPARA